MSSCFNPRVTSAPSDWETLAAALNDFIDGLRTALATIEPDAARLI
ncbi:hypothetical protein [Propionibacterium australiense]|nr:hypothetical protein [Propionibacterium australiense]